MLFYVLYLFHGNVSGVVPLVAGWRETKLKCTIGLCGKKLQSHFFPSLNYIKVNITVTPKSLALFCLEALDLQCQPSLTPAGQSTSQSASQPVGGWVRVGWGGGVSTECLFAVVLWVSGGSPTAQHFLLGSTWPFLSLTRKTAPPGLTNHGSLPHTASPLGAHHHSTLLSSCPLPPSLSSLTQRSL